MITSNEIKEDHRSNRHIYIHYSVAKREGIKAGSEFVVDISGKEKFKAIEYINYRNDINSSFSGFRCEHIGKGE